MLSNFPEVTLLLSNKFKLRTLDLSLSTIGLLSTPASVEARLLAVFAQL